MSKKNTKPQPQTVKAYARSWEIEHAKIMNQPFKCWLYPADSCDVILRLVEQTDETPSV